jgi:hypothetical protein
MVGMYIQIDDKEFLCMNFHQRKRLLANLKCMFLVARSAGNERIPKNRRQ